MSDCEKGGKHSFKIIEEVSGPTILLCSKCDLELSWKMWEEQEAGKAKTPELFRL